MNKLKTIAGIIVFSVMTSSVFAADSSQSSMAGVNVAAASSSSGGLQIPSEIPNMVKGHSTSTSVYQTFPATCSAIGCVLYGGFDRPQIIIPARVSFNGAGAGTLHFGGYIRNVHGQFTGNFPLTLVGVVGDGYRYRTSHLAPIYVDVTFTGVTISALTGGVYNYSGTYFRINPSSQYSYLMTYFIPWAS